VQAPAILHRHLVDDVPDVQLVRPTRALVRRCNREWHPRLQVGRPRTRSHAGRALDRDAADSAADPYLIQLGLFPQSDRLCDPITKRFA
jgi:hypothetical protein